MDLICYTLNNITVCDADANVNEKVSASLLDPRMIAHILMRI